MKWQVRCTWDLWEEGQLQNSQLRTGDPVLNSSRGALSPQYTEVLAGLRNP